MHAEPHSELLKKCDERTKEKASALSSSRQLTRQVSSDNSCRGKKKMKYREEEEGKAKASERGQAVAQANMYQHGSG